MINARSNDLKALPTIPTVAMELLAAFSDPDVPIPTVVEIIRKDPAITAKLLKAANSPYYGGSHKIDTIERAVVWLGKHAVVCLALSFSLAEEGHRAGPFAGHYKEIWLSSVVQALSMEWLAKRYQPASQGAAFVAGLLADIGRLAFLKKEPDAYAAVMGRAREQGQPIEQLELERLGATHAEMSAELLRAWSLPDGIVAVAQYHAMPVDKLFAVEQRDDFPQIAAANIAAATADFLLGLSPANSFDRLHRLTAWRYGFTDDQIDEYLTAMRQRLSETTELFDTDVSQLPSTVELLASAMEQLAHFSLRAADAPQRSAGASGELQQENEQLRSKLGELEKRTSTDELTQVYTREYWQTRLAQRLDQCAVAGFGTAVLFIDVDHFKQVNDTFGHAVGDEVLKMVASLTSGSLRDHDVVARFGGDEFVVLLGVPGAAQTEKIARRIQARIAAERIGCGDHQLTVTVSIGGAFAAELPSDREVEEFQKYMVRAADQAMYEAKQNGRDQVVVRDLGCHAGAEDRTPATGVAATLSPVDVNADGECSFCS